jgi:hypothetical protein
MIKFFLERTPKFAFLVCVLGYCTRAVMSSRAAAMKNARNVTELVRDQLYCLKGKD